MDPQPKPENEKEKPDSNPDDPTPAPLPDNDKAKEIEKKEESPCAETTGSKEEKPCVCQISVVDKTPDKWNKANRISIIAAAINVVVVIAYGLLYAQGQRAAQETKREFETSNRPFVVLSAVRIDSVKVGERPIIWYNLTNNGRFPALVTSFKNYIGSATAENTANEIQTAAEKAVKAGPDTNIGIIPFAPTLTQQSVQCGDPFTKDQIDEIYSGQRFFTCTVEIKYMNMVTKVPYYYIQVIKIITVPTFVPTSMKYTDDPDNSK